MTVNHSSDQLIGQVLDTRYEILTRVARGGMATVYRAKDLRLGRTVALKVMHEGLADDEGFATKFDREAKSAAKLVHPNVVGVFDQGSHDGRPYIVMELVEGLTLRHLIAKDSPMSALQALELLEPVAAALAAAHEAGLVHRDIKPENVLISRLHEVKVGDFGLAKAVTGQTATATQGLLIGTVSYLPPEVVISGKADSSSDIYSTGVVLFELLTGKKPYTGDSPIQVAYAHVHNDIPAPSKEVVQKPNPIFPGKPNRAKLPPIPAYVDELVKACTSRRKELRPADGRQLLTLIREVKKALANGVFESEDLIQLIRTTNRAQLLGAARNTSHDEDQELTEPIRENSLTRLRRKLAGRLTAGSASGIVDTQNGQIDLVDDSGTEFTPVQQRAPIFPNRIDTALYRRRRRVVLALLLMVALVAGGGSAWWFTSGRYLATPALAGMTQAEAKQKAEQNGLSIAFAEEYSETVPAGSVIRTDPIAGAKIKKKSRMSAWVSKGPERFSVPDLAGKTLAAAGELLTENNLKTGQVSEEYSDSVAAGVVISAGTKAGSQVKRDTAIDLKVSKGPQPIPITNYTGKDANTAANELKTAGFKVETEQQFSTSVAKGLVISQTPNSGTGKRSDVIKLVTSKGPEMVKVPSVAWKSESAAKQTLEKAGFKVKVIYATESWLRLKIASSTSPAAGTSVAKGSEISLYIV